MCNLTPKSLWRVGAQETWGLQPQSQPQGTRTPDWPAQPATKPRAPRAKPPSGTRHTRARSLSGKKIINFLGGGDREGTPRTAKLPQLLKPANATLTE